MEHVLPGHAMTRTHHVSQRVATSSTPYCWGPILFSPACLMLSLRGCLCRPSHGQRIAVRVTMEAGIYNILHTEAEGAEFLTAQHCPWHVALYIMKGPPLDLIPLVSSFWGKHSEHLSCKCIGARNLEFLYLKANNLSMLEIWNRNKILKICHKEQTTGGTQRVSGRKWTDNVLGWYLSSENLKSMPTLKFTSEK